MTAGVVPGTGPPPRRARYLIPPDLPRRGEVLAACATAILLAHLLLAQVTLLLAIVFTGVSRASRWRLWWLLCPGLAGLAWVLVAGPASAFAGFAAGPAGFLRYVSGGHLFSRLAHPVSPFAGLGHWLPGQFPVALLASAAEAAVVGWLDWLHTDEWAVPAARPGVIATLRATVTAGMIRAGAVITRDGCALGVAQATGAMVELSWREAADGVLVAGADEWEVAITSLQLVHAALRRRKAVLVLDTGGDPPVAAALTAACRATSTRLRLAGAPVLAATAADYTDLARTGLARTGLPRTGPAGSSVADAVNASDLWGRGKACDPGPHPSTDTDPAGLDLGLDLGRVVRERAAALLPADSPERADRACAGIAAVIDDLRRIGVDGDGLVWVPDASRVPADALGKLIRNGRAAGLAVLVSTASPPTAGELAGLAGVLVIHRIADPSLAGRLAARTGTRLLPASAATALGVGAGVGQQAPSAGAPGLSASGQAAAQVPLQVVVPAVASGQDLVPCPAVPPRTLASLPPARFVLAVSSPRRRLVALGRLVPARLPGDTASGVTPC